MWLGGVLLLILLLSVALDSRLTVRTYVVTSEKLTQPVRLAVLSDLHSCAYGEDQRDLLEAVGKLRPDAVLFTGDIVDDELPEENAFVVLAALAEAYPCFYVTGNHEYRSGRAEEIKAEIAALGIRVLEGTWSVAELNGQTIVFCGVDDPESGRSEVQLARAGESRPEERFSVLLAHRPERIEDYLAYGFDLILSGHAHGGQWRIPGLLNGLLAPNQGLFPQYAGGRYDWEGTVFLVSRGLARESTRVPRIFNPPELVAVDLVPEEDS